jgi:hypothetical protein
LSKLSGFFSLGFPRPPFSFVGECVVFFRFAQ